MSRLILTSGSWIHYLKIIKTTIQPSHQNLMHWRVILSKSKFWLMHSQRDFIWHTAATVMKAVSKCACCLSEELSHIFPGVFNNSSWRKPSSGWRFHNFIICATFRAHLYIFLCMSPITFRAEIAQLDELQLSERYLRDCSRYFASHKRLTWMFKKLLSYIKVKRKNAMNETLRNWKDQFNWQTSSWTLVIEKNSITGKHVVCFAIVDHNPIAVQFGACCKQSFYLHWLNSWWTRLFGNLTLSIYLPENLCDPTDVFISFYAVS